MSHIPPLRVLMSGAGALALSAGLASADQVIADDLIVDGSLCVGLDCVNNENFGFDTIRLKENNLRIKFDDTSVAAAFPSRDWEIIANDSANGGSEYLAIRDVTGSNQVARFFGGARNNALVVDAQGDLGLGTSTPTTDIHVKIGDTPTLRLEQDGTSGFTPQTWDVAGNEAGFFVRDATGGSALPLRIRPGVASSAIDVHSDGIGVFNSNPQAIMHIRRSAGDAELFIEETNAAADPRTLLRIKNTGRPEIVLGNTTQGREWAFGGGSNFIMKVGDIDTDSAAKTKHFDLNGTTGNLVITGSITTGGGTCGGGCDLVFTPEYDLPEQADYADAMWTQGYLPNVGPTIENAPINVSDKLGRMLNALEHAHIFIDAQAGEIAALRAEVGELRQMVTAD